MKKYLFVSQPLWIALSGAGIVASGCANQKLFGTDVEANTKTIISEMLSQQDFPEYFKVNGGCGWLWLLVFLMVIIVLLLVIRKK